MEKIIEYINQTYQPLGIIVYGSFADGSNNDHSDFDAIVITTDGDALHDNAVVAGIELDVFVYPREAFAGDIHYEKYIQIYDGIIISDSDGTASRLKASVNQYINSIVIKSATENRTSVEWCEKMLLRASRNDAEGFYRWHWLLMESLEIYCDLRGKRYLGPKKSIKDMQINDPAGAEIYMKALGQFDYSALTAWVSYLRKIVDASL